MDELRQRKLGEDHSNDSDNEDQDLESEDEDIAIPGASADRTKGSRKQQSAELKNLTSGNDTTPEMLNAVTRNMSSKWKNWTIRVILGIVMISIFFLIIYLGPLALVLLVMVIQLKCFSEIINIGHIVYKSENLPLFRTLSWYFLFTSNYFIYGETMIDQFGLLLHKTNFLSPLVTYHRFISLSLYLAGIISFVMSLKKKYYVKQFTLFGYTHVTLLILAVGANMIIRNIFEGIFWFFMACSLIICNDIWAYFFGFFFGKTPLIALSPKKTWEGYIGGGLATLVYAAIVANIMVGHDNLVCPVEYSLNLTGTCVRNPVFIQTNYTLPSVLQTISRQEIVTMYPITFHSLNLAAFASLIGPFGGFFASGFKRAFKIKDFGDIFPGHGGFVDRFDCQILMGFFTNVYVLTFVKIPNPEKILQLICAMQPPDQIIILEGLCNFLQGKGIVNCDHLSLKT